MRTVEVPQEAAEYRCRIEEGVTTLTRQPRWRMVVERLWTAIPTGMVEPHFWKRHKNGRWRNDEEQARQDAEQWLDKAERRAADDADYV